MSIYTEDFGGFSDLPGKSSNPINNRSRNHDVWFDVPRSSRNFSPTNTSSIRHKDKWCPSSEVDSAKSADPIHLGAREIFFVAFRQSPLFNHLAVIQ